MAGFTQGQANAKDGQMQQTALRLVRCLGSRAARDYCLAQEWTGLYEQLCRLENGNALNG